MIVLDLNAPQEGRDGDLWDRQGSGGRERTVPPGGGGEVAELGEDQGCHREKRFGDVHELIADAFRPMPGLINYLGDGLILPISS